MALITRSYDFGNDGKCLECNKTSRTSFVHKKCMYKFARSLEKAMDVMNNKARRAMGKKRVA